MSQNDIVKAMLLRKYSRKEPKVFLQCDAAPNMYGDTLFGSDAEGDQFISFGVVDLMHGYPVRVLIDPKTKKKDAVRLLEKIVASMKRTSQKKFGVIIGDPIKREIDSVRRTIDSLDSADVRKENECDGPIF